MCGGSDRATRQAQANEDARQRQIRESTAAIDRAFAGRAGQLDNFVNALREQFTGEARKQKERVDRRAKFNTARAGLTGGSADADLKVRIGEDFQEGILQGERLAQGSLADLIAADQQSKINLLALAQGGADVTTAARNAGTALRSNLEGARARGSLESLGDIFADTRSVFLSAEDAAQRRRGLRESQLFADPFSRGTN